jgi:hypothetical protein
MKRQEGYYWVKAKHIGFVIALWEVDNLSSDGAWMLAGKEYVFHDVDFEHINEVRIKQPGELPE